MSTSPGYKALLIRVDARAAVDDAKKLHAEQTGIDLNYSQFIMWLCKEYMKSNGSNEQ